MYKKRVRIAVLLVISVVLLCVQPLFAYATPQYKEGWALSPAEWYGFSPDHYYEDFDGAYEAIRTRNSSNADDITNSPYITETGVDLTLFYDYNTVNKRTDWLYAWDMWLYDVLVKPSLDIPEGDFIEFPSTQSVSRYYLFNQGLSEIDSSDILFVSTPSLYPSANVSLIDVENMEILTSFSMNDISWGSGGSTSSIFYYPTSGLYNVRLFGFPDFSTDNPAPPTYYAIKQGNVSYLETLGYISSVSSTDYSGAYPVIAKYENSNRVFSDPLLVGGSTVRFYKSSSSLARTLYGDNYQSIEENIITQIKNNNLQIGSGGVYTYQDLNSALAFGAYDTYFDLLYEYVVMMQSAIPSDKHSKYQFVISVTGRHAYYNDNGVDKPFLDYHEGLSYATPSGDFSAGLDGVDNAFILGHNDSFWSSLEMRELLRLGRLVPVCINNYVTNENGVITHTGTFMYDSGQKVVLMDIGSDGILTDEDNVVIDEDGEVLDPVPLPDYIPDNPPDDRPDLARYFPFSLPWDVVGIATTFSAMPKTPSFQTTFPFMGHDYPVDINLSRFDTFANAFRWFVRMSVIIALLWSFLGMIGIRKGEE